MPDEAIIDLPPKLVPVFEGAATVRGAYGGRGSGKTRSFAAMIAIRGLWFAEAGIEGQLLCAREHLNSLDESSMAEVKAAIRAIPWLNAYYDIGEKYIRTKNRRVYFTFAGLRTNVESIKSRARILICWVDEAEKVQESSWRVLTPTLRDEGEGWEAELWVTWNPLSDRSATHIRFRKFPPANSKIVEMNWRDNPWFPSRMEKERLEDQRLRPDTYEHVWEGDFLKALLGSYFAPALKKIEQNGQICSIPIEPGIKASTFWDLGLNRRSGQMAIWIVQPVGKERRHIGCYCNADHGLPHYIQWLWDFGEKHNIRYDKHYAPHDISVRELSSGKSRLTVAKELGIEFERIPQVDLKQTSIDAANAAIPYCWFDKERCADGLDALWHYHREFDEDRQAFKGQPYHDWSSDFSDAFQQEAMAYDKMEEDRKPPEPETDPWASDNGTSWMG